MLTLNYDNSRLRDCVLASVRRICTTMKPPDTHTRQCYGKKKNRFHAIHSEIGSLISLRRRELRLTELVMKNQSD